STVSACREAVIQISAHPAFVFLEPLTNVRARATVSVPNPRCAPERARPLSAPPSSHQKDQSMKCSMIAMLVVALAIPLTGCGGSNAVGSYGGATPEAAFENFKSANKNKDFKSALGQTTPETQEMTIAGLAVFAPMMAAIDPAKGADK